MWGPSGRAWREGDFKLIEGAEDGRSLLFDVRADPREVRNLAPERAELVEQMNRTVGVVEEQGSGDSASPILADLTPEEREHLRALGYGQ
jgi:arylsulfatase A-like enzyme